MIRRRSILKMLSIAPIASALAALPAVAEIVKGKQVYDPRLGSRLIVTNGTKELAVQAAEKLSWIDVEVEGCKVASLSHGEATTWMKFDEFSRFKVKCYRYDGGDQRAVNFDYEFRDARPRRKGPIPFPLQEPFRA